MLEAFATGPWQAMVLGRDYVRRLPPERALTILSAMSGFAGQMGWQLFCDGLPAGLGAEVLYAAGIRASSTDVVHLPDLSA